MRMLVLADSLAFFGPEHVEPLTEPRLWPNVTARALGADVDVVARLGWTARDGWWAVTKDPAVWSLRLPAADVLVLALGQFDQLPASLPSYLREGIAYVRPGTVRRPLRRAWLAAHPLAVRAWGRWLRQLPQAATDAYLARIVRGVRHFHPQLPVVLLGPSPHAAASYPWRGGHAPAVAAARAFAASEDVALVELDPLVGPHLEAGRNNPDGLHWGWETHAAVGAAVAGRIADVTGTRLLLPGPR